MTGRRCAIPTFLTAAPAAAAFVAALLSGPGPATSLAQAQPDPATQDQRQPVEQMVPVPDRPAPAPAGGAPSDTAEPAAAQRPGSPTTAPTTAPTTSPSAAGPRGNGPDVAGDLQRLGDVLRNPNSRPADRDDAAARLISRQSPDADAILRDVLGSGAPPARTAAARALADDPLPREEFIGPLASLLAGGEQHSAALAEAAANALSGYRRNGVAVGHLVRAAADSSQAAAVRIPAVRALGRMIEPAAAQALVTLANAPAPERPEVRAAAVDALTDMTGLPGVGRDPRRWAQWLQQNNPANNVDAWRANLLENRAAALDRVRRRHEGLLADTKQRFRSQYQASDKEKRQAVLLDLLGSGEPELRVTGTELVTQAMLESEDIPDAVRDRLVAMVGDPDPQVRLRAAETVHNMNYAGALGPLLTQLAQERDDRVKVALAEAVQPVADASAVPTLLALLNDNTPPAVAVAVVRALGEAARNLRTSDPSLAATVADRLRRIARNPRVSGDLRVAALDAMAPLKDRSTLGFARQLLNDPSPAVRQATLRVLGDLGPNEDAAELAANVLRNAGRDPELRKLALEALGRTGGLTYANTLNDYMQPRETDPEVREAAWQAMKAALPRASDAQLQGVAQMLRADADRHIFVVQALAERHRQRGGPDDMRQWAAQVENVAEDELRLKNPRRADAAGHFVEALNYWLRNGGEAQTIESLTRRALEARLAAGQYAQATMFAQAAIADRGPAAREVVGPIITNEADRLHTARDDRAAVALIESALKMDPPLDDRHVRRLRTIQAEIQGPASDGRGTAVPTQGQ